MNIILKAFKIIFRWSYYYRMAKAVKKEGKGKKENLNISDVEQYIIDRVKEIRTEKGISQRELSYLLEMSQGFIAKVENPNLRAKYNINHVYKIAEVFHCEIMEILPALKRKR